MPWFRVDDAFYRCPKVLSIPRKARPAAVGLWALAGTWSTDNLTDGKVPAYMLVELGATPRVAQALVDATLWEVTEDGYLFHDWQDYQPTKSQVEAKRKATAEKVSNWRARNRPSNQDVTGLQDGHSPVGNTAPVPEPEPVPRTNSGSSLESPLGGRDDTNRREASSMVSEYLSILAERRAPKPPRAVVGALVGQIANLLAEDIPAPVVGRALLVWHDKGLGAGALPSVVHEVQTPRKIRPAAGGVNLDAAMARAIERENQHA